MSIDTAYRELGLTPGASEAEIKAAWRRLASRWHPDRNDSRAAVEKMQRINRAFEALRAGLGDGVAFADASAAAEPESPAAGEPQAAAGAEDDGPATEETTAGGPDGGTDARPLQRRVKLTLEEAALGCVRVLRGQLTGVCAACTGAGLRWPGGDCSTCEGGGRVHQRAWYGWMASTVDCEDCGGDGRARLLCADCGGSGKRAPQRYELKVRIPAGVRDGDLLAVPPDRRRAGPPGGLDLRIELQPHPIFTLDDDGTVRAEFPVDGFRWIAGRAVDAPTLEGLQPLALRRDEHVYRLRGRGFPATRRGTRADLLLTVRPTFPQPLSADQQILLDRLIATTGEPAAGPLADWRRRLRQWSPTGAFADAAASADDAARPRGKRRPAPG